MCASTRRFGGQITLSFPQRQIRFPGGKNKNQKTKNPQSLLCCCYYYYWWLWLLVLSTCQCLLTFLFPLTLLRELVVGVSAGSLCPWQDPWSNSRLRMGKPCAWSKWPSCWRWNLGETPQAEPREVDQVPRAGSDPPASLTCSSLFGVGLGSQK